MAREVPRELVDNLSTLVNGISENARAGLLEELATIDLTDIDAVIEVMQRWCAIATDAAALVNANFYDLARAIQLGQVDGFEAVADSGRIPTATEVATRGAANQSRGDAQRFASLLADRLDYETRRAAGDNTFINGRRDPRKPRYARVPSGSETCTFCMMLASRGFVYHSELSAGSLDHYHPNCDCRVVAGFNGASSSVAGYDPSDWYSRWQDSMLATAEGRAERRGTSVDEEMREIRDQLARSAASAHERARRRR